MKKIAVCTILLLCISISLQAHHIDSTTALTVARHFYENLCKTHSPISNPKLAYQSSFTQIENEGNHFVEKQVPSFYVANFGNEGFVIVAADDRVNPILAFSTEGAFVSENIPTHILFFLGNYTSEIKQVVNENFAENKETASLWTALLEGSVGTQKDGAVTFGLAMATAMTITSISIGAGVAHKTVTTPSLPAVRMDLTAIMRL